MNISLQIRRNGSLLFERTYDIRDADSFGRACADAWTQLRDQRLSKTTSIGALYDALDDQLLEGLMDAQISLSKADDNK